MKLKLSSEERALLIEEHHREIAGREAEDIPTDPEERQQAIIRQFLSTKAGVKLLADSMTQPTRCGGKDYP